MCYQHLIIFDDTSVIYYGFVSSTLSIPCVLRAVATKVSLFVTAITLNFAKVSLQPSSLSLHKSSSGCVSSLRCGSSARYISSSHGAWIYFFTSCDLSAGSSCRCIHGVWVGELSSWCPSTLSLCFWCGVSSMCLQSCFHMDVGLLLINGCLFPLFIGVWLVKFKYFLV